MFTKQALKNKSVLGEAIKACATVLIAKIGRSFLLAPFPQLARAVSSRGAKDRRGPCSLMSIKTIPQGSGKCRSRLKHLTLGGRCTAIVL